MDIKKSNFWSKRRILLNDNLIDTTLKKLNNDIFCFFENRDDLNRYIENQGSPTIPSVKLIIELKLGPHISSVRGDFIFTDKSLKIPMHDAYKKQIEKNHIASITVIDEEIKNEAHNSLKKKK